MALQLTPAKTLTCLIQPDTQDAQATAIVQLGNLSRDHALAFSVCPLNVWQLSKDGAWFVRDMQTTAPTLLLSMPVGTLQPGATTTIELNLKPAKGQATLQAGQAYTLRVCYSDVAPAGAVSSLISESLRTTAQYVRVKTLELHMVRISL